ncbi:MAG: DUF3365 domain-containing protein [Leptospira sp.]|nr:DUF3365 domain-containing protein [Leptospira sp.]
MRNFKVILIVTLFSFLISCSGASEEEKKVKSLVLFKDLGTELKTELIQSVKERGAENSIEVCAKLSPEIEERISQENGLSLKRISDKNRNPNHAPQDWENEVIQNWKADLEKGIQPAVFTQKAGDEFRVMKPIVIDNPTCLKCHGMESDIEKATLEKIQVVYPMDKAKGYKMGDIRGAFSASWKI